MRKVLAVLGLVLSGCVSATPQGEKVRLTDNPRATAGCKFLGSVQGIRPNTLRNEGAKLGADVVFPTMVGGPHGEAYKCPEALK